jgi:small ligand-binding sensory domain FIST
LVLMPRAVFGARSGAERSDLGGEVLAEAAAQLGTPEIVGAVVEASFGAGASALAGLNPSAVVYAMAGVEARSVGLHSAQAPEEALEEEIEASLGRSLDERDLVLLFAEPTRVNIRRLLAGIEIEPTPPALVGIGATDPLLGGGHVAVEVAALVIRSSRAPRIEISQACRPVSSLLQVTAAEGHWIYEIDDRPALRTYREVARDPLSADLRRAAQRIVVGLPMLPAGANSAGDASSAFADGRFAARSITGFDEIRGAFAISEPLRPGADIALLLRDGALARDELKQALDGCNAAAAFYLSCAGRGAALFGHEGLEEGYVDAALSPTPWVGMRGALQIAPLAGAPRLLQYAGVLALLEPKA